MEVNANAQLAQWADMVRGLPVGKPIKAPWSDAVLGDEDQAAVVALIDQGVIGAAVVMKKDGEKLRLYLGRNHHCSSFFRLLNGWSFCALMALWFALALYLASMKFFWADMVGLVVSVIALAYFGMHGFVHFQWAELFLHLRRLGEQTRLGSCALGASIALGAVFEFAGRVI
jgi:hypothetical protein